MTNLAAIPNSVFTQCQQIKPSFPRQVLWEFFPDTFPLAHNFSDMLKLRFCMTLLSSSVEEFRLFIGNEEVLPQIYSAESPITIADYDIRRLIPITTTQDKGEFKGMTMFIGAAKLNNIAAVKAMAPFVYNFEHADAKGRTALAHAVDDQHLDMLEALAALGVNMNGENEHGVPLLLTSILLNRPKVVEKLLQLGTNPNTNVTAGNYNLTCLIAALTDWLPQGQKMQDPHKMIQILVDAKVDVDAAVDKKTTPLMLAAAKNFVSSLEVLIDAGAKLDLQNEADETALHIAIRHLNVKAIKLLIDRGARLDIPNAKVKTPKNFLEDSLEELKKTKKDEL